MIRPDRRNKLAALAVGLLAHENSSECTLDEFGREGEKVSFDCRAKPVVTLTNIEVSDKLVDNVVPIDINNVEGRFTEYTINGEGYWRNLTKQGKDVDEATRHRLDKVLVGLSMGFCRMLVQDQYLRDVLIKKRSPTDKHGVELG